MKGETYDTETTVILLAVGAVLAAAGSVVVVAVLDAQTTLPRVNIEETTLQSTPIRKVPRQSTPGQQARLQVATLKVSNLYCASCPFIIRQTLEEAKGVIKAEVSYRKKTAVVT